PPLESRWGGREFLKFYVICGLGGVVLGFFYLPTAVIGASAALYGLMLAFALNWPDAPIYIWGIFPVKAKWLVAFLFLVSLVSTLDGSAGGGTAHFAHLGGLATGYIYLKGRWGVRTGAQHVSRVVRTRRLAIVPREERDDAIPSARAAERNEDKVLYDRVDAVLDKISAHGMASLTPDELKLLDEVSRRHRAN
ncbi:MAG TPA: rhomboid family intramembrane serine protease, partial [Longimicrobiales bacterium]|nr:rhomboid family intramembrane serine protease [Longimicrobiales bacterium]